MFRSSSPVFAAPRGPAEERSGALDALWQALGQLLTPLFKLGPTMTRPDHRSRRSGLLDPGSVRACRPSPPRVSGGTFFLRSQVLKLPLL